ncbi:MAG: putative SigmaB asociated two-component system sensor protein, partial [Labilithrix sp.]|nr:putative SigmaB asociated two-component system sensor protein [Labilithrix sp.]
DVRNLFAVSSLLERRGAKVIAARSARECFELLERTAHIDIVLMDLMIPEMDGSEATRLLRKDPRYQALPVIALTAKALPDDREKALEAGCSDFVPKPIEQGRLLEVIARWARKERS